MDESSTHAGGFFFAVTSLFSDDKLVDSSSSNVEPIGNGVGKLNLKRGMSLLIQGGGGLDMYQGTIQRAPL